MNNKVFRCVEDVCECVGVKEIISSDLHNFVVGSKVCLIVDGKEIKRKVYDSAEHGIYVRIRNTMVGYYDFY